MLTRWNRCVQVLILLKILTRAPFNSLLGRLSLELDYFAGSTFCRDVVDHHSFEYFFPHRLKSDSSLFPRSTDNPLAVRLDQRPRNSLKGSWCTAEAFPWLRTPADVPGFAPDGFFQFLRALSVHKTDATIYIVT